LNSWFFISATVLVWAGHPIVTRWGITRGFGVDDLVALRFGISTLLFLPALVKYAPQCSVPVLARGMGFAVSQGAPLSLVIFSGLALAPASHASSLVLGLIPLWVAFGSIVFYGDRYLGITALGLGAIAAGAFIFAWGAGEPDAGALKGDFLFVGASMLAAAYFILSRGSNIPAELAAALIAGFSALLYLPLYLLQSDSQLSAPTLADWAIQILYQGVLIGFASFIWLNRAIGALGSSVTAAVLSLVPALTALLAIPVLGEVPTAQELSGIALITIGVLCASRKSVARAAAT
jgi:drug/metabolite transporter (DMT)-like permease